MKEGGVCGHLITDCQLLQFCLNNEWVAMRHLFLDLKFTRQSFFVSPFFLFSHVKLLQWLILVGYERIHQPLAGMRAAEMRSHLPLTQNSYMPVREENRCEHVLCVMSFLSYHNECCVLCYVGLWICLVMFSFTQNLFGCHKQISTWKRGCHSILFMCKPRNRIC